ncbi:hypothetical protein B0T25DRAFT_325189 [Lasiosphaeria hispida]|uniref:Uncharacterized protein n=1 Tax=Lasiosphaeria hispida TaxID=260671 RepID=A0AAJ0M9V1_9PEZI|nr:hypothetical protein B0T25DRAFT_325189 [Lasiosphaeria hispida]
MVQCQHCSFPCLSSFLLHTTCRRDQSKSTQIPTMHARCHAMPRNKLWHYNYSLLNCLLHGIHIVARGKQPVSQSASPWSNYAIEIHPTGSRDDPQQKSRNRRPVRSSSPTVTTSVRGRVCSMPAQPDVPSSPDGPCCLPGPRRSGMCAASAQLPCRAATPPRRGCFYVSRRPSSHPPPRLSPARMPARQLRDHVAAPSFPRGLSRGLAVTVVEACGG